MSQFFVNSVSSGNLPPNVPTSFVTDSGTAVPALNILNVLGGTGSSTSGAGNTITINVKTDSFTWSNKTASFNAVKQNGYFCRTNSLTVNLPDPAVSTLGDTIIIYVDESNAVIVQAFAGSFIQVGSDVSNVGGTSTSNAIGSVLQLVYNDADLTWHSISTMGTWTTV